MQTAGRTDLQIDGFWAVIPAGGAGTRLWPLSRRHAPKFLLDLTGTGRTLLQGTWDRLAPLAGERIVLVTGQTHAAAVAAQLPQLRAAYLLAEPSPRDSMPAIAWAAAVIARADPDAVLGSFAADHVIGGVEGFHAAVTEAVAVARTGAVVTIGITPTQPATGFGYVKEGMPLDLSDAPSARAVLSFVEKPDAATAAAYLAEGGYRWNAGMFVVRATVLLDLLRHKHPAIVAGVEAIADDPTSLERVWPTLTKITIDHAVAEPAAAAGRVAVVPATFDWDDVGDVDALAGVLADRHGVAVDGLRVLGDPELVVGVAASGLVCAGSGRVVAVVGLADVVVIDTPDAVLVVPRSQAQQVKAVVDALGARGLDHLR